MEDDPFEEGKGYREALIPAAELNRYAAWAAWECSACGRVAAAGSPGWRTDEWANPITGATEHAETCTACCT